MSEQPDDTNLPRQPSLSSVMHADLDLDRMQLIKDLQRGFSGEVPYDYITKLKYYDARLLLVFAGTSSGPDSYCTGAVVSKSGPLGDAQELFNVFGRLCNESRRLHQLQRADDGSRCYLYLDSGFRHDDPVGRGPCTLVEWFERNWDI